MSRRGNPTTQPAARLAGRDRAAPLPDRERHQRARPAAERLPVDAEVKLCQPPLTPSEFSIFVIEPLVGSKNCEFTVDQPPRSLMVNSCAGVGNFVLSRSAG